MVEAGRSLVLWDIDRTLLYVGEIDRQVYRETFAEIVGRPAERLPARGTGVTMPLAIRSLLLENGVPASDVPLLLPRMVELLPKCLTAHEKDLRDQAVLMPGAVSALKAVHEQNHCVPTVVTGNLKSSALLKLEGFGLDAFLDTEIGGYSSDDEHRPALVAVAQRRAQAKLGVAFTRSNTVIIGDSLEDVRTGVVGGASVIGIASGKTTAHELASAGADVVLDSLEDVPQLLGEITALTQTFAES
ncbi:HAD family hydrolase [Streptomyces sp. NBC_00299]|uniref:HAD family hydrolase n=1 Tax=Streptomyces sp. NBC_00299 TaxID=2975705 RepID=UPI002E2A6FEA|nr:haloacid dehalogenase-like hydrolase [Streptomyces sp. NBC_00299]